MRFNSSVQLHLGRLIPIAATGLLALAACTPNLDDKLACDNSSQCPTGYFCGPDGKCQTGDSVPEITVLTPTTGVTFSGVISLQMSVIDPEGITSVAVGLSGTDGGAPIAATPGANNIYSVSIDTRALGISSSGGFTATITATNSKGKTGTASVQLQIDDQPPALGNVGISPASVTAGQGAMITFDVGETLAMLPVVKVTPPDNSGVRHAAYVSVEEHTYTFQYAPLSTDPVGVWHVQITAQDSSGNSISTDGSDAFNVVAGGTQSVNIAGVRSDSVSDARAFYLKIGASVAVTATFGGALTGNASAFLCPVGTPGPCTASTTGSTSFTVAPGAAANAYTFTIPAVTASGGEGSHVLTVSGNGVSGGAISSSINVIYDFSAPVFTLQRLDSDGNSDEQGRDMVSIALDGTLRYLALVNEAQAGLASISAVIDATATAVPLDPHPTELSSIPQFVLTLDGSLASTPPVADSFAGHAVNATVCDLANNCSTQGSAPFVEVDGAATLAFDYPNEFSQLLPDGGVPVLAQGSDIYVGVRLDRALPTDFVAEDSLSVELDNPNDPSGESSITLTPFLEYTGTGDEPFGYYFYGTVPSYAIDGAYEIKVVAGFDGYGNEVTPELASSGPFVQIKTSAPVLTTSNSQGGVISGNPNAMGLGTLQTFFVSKSNGALDNLGSGALSVCIDPQITGTTLACPAGSSASSGGLSASLRVTSAPGVGELDLTAAAGASGSHFVLVNFTDAAGNLGALPFNILVDTAKPTLLSWSLDKTQAPPKGIATLTVNFTDATALGTPVGSVGSGTPGTVTVGSAASLGNGAWQIPFTLPATCSSATAFTIGFTIADAVGNSYSSAVLTPQPSIACIVAPQITNVSFDKTLVGPGQTATATVSLSEALGSISGSSVTGSASSGGAALAGVTATSSNVSSEPRVYTIAFKMPSACQGGNNPPDDVAFQVFATLNDGANSTAPLALGSLTCAGSSIASATVSSSLVFLIKQPMGDGTVRSVVAASPNALSGSTGSGAGISLVAYSGSTIVGSGPLLSDKSVAEFQLSSALTQVTLKFTDLLGNTKPVTGYGEELDVNAIGVNVGSGATNNPFQMYDVTTGDDTFYAPAYWIDGGPGLSGNAQPISNNTIAALGEVDGQYISLGDAGVFVADAGVAGSTMTTLGAMPFGDPLINGSGVSPAARTAGSLTTTLQYGSTNFGAYDSLLLMGGRSGSAAVDPTGTIWTWTRDSGWTSGLYNNFTGGTPAVANAATGVDYLGNFYAIGGTNAAGTGLSSIVELTSSTLADGGVNYAWTDGGVLGVPSGTGTVSSAAVETPIAFASGYTEYFYNSAGANSPNSLPMTVFNTAGVNCLLFMPAYPYGTTYGPATNALYNCSGGNVWNTRNGPALVNINGFNSAWPAHYGVFAFGGGGTAVNNYASADLIAAVFTYSSTNTTMSVSWTTLNAGSVSTPAARSGASLYFNADTQRIGLFGGINAAGAALNDSWEYDVPTNIWTRIDNPHANAITAPARTAPMGAGLDGNLYMFGGSGQSDGWTMGRETRNRYIAKVPIASQLSAPASANVSGLEITVAGPSHFNGNQGLVRSGPGLASPELTQNDGSSAYDLYLWSGSAWQYVTTYSSYIQTYTIPAASLPSIATGDGNYYVMIAGAPTDLSYSTPSSMTLDAFTFALKFQ